MPAVSMTVTAELSTLLGLRSGFNEGRGGERVSMTHLAIKAVGKALRRYPAFYSAFHENRLCPAESLRVNLPVAEGRHVEYVVVDSPESKSVLAIASEVREEVARIREGRGRFFSGMRRAAMAPRLAWRLAEARKSSYLRRYNEWYGNFPITNFGSFGAESGVPALASPAVAALCLGRVSEGPRAAMKLTLAFDHRCADGAEAGGLLCAIKAELEERAGALFECKSAPADLGTEPQCVMGTQASMS